MKKVGRKKKSTAEWRRASTVKRIRIWPLMYSFSLMCSQKFSKMNYEMFKYKKNIKIQTKLVCFICPRCPALVCPPPTPPSPHSSSTLLCVEHLQQKDHHSDSAKLTKKPTGTRNRCLGLCSSLALCPILVVTQHYFFLVPASTAYSVFKFKTHRME